MYQKQNLYEGQSIAALPIIIFLNLGLFPKNDLINHIYRFFLRKPKQTMLKAIRKLFLAGNMANLQANSPLQAQTSLYKASREGLLYNKQEQMRFKSKEAPNQQQTQLYDRITKIEDQVLQKISKLKANIKTHICQHLDINSPQCGPYDPSVDYYSQYWKRFLINDIGKQCLRQTQISLQQFQRKLEKIGALFTQREREMQPFLLKKKQKSRSIDETLGKICQHCGRRYKDQEALIIHQKIKHQQQRLPEAKQHEDESIYEEESD